MKRDLIWLGLVLAKLLLAGLLGILIGLTINLFT